MSCRFGAAVVGAGTVLPRGNELLFEFEDEPLFNSTGIFRYYYDYGGHQILVMLCLLSLSQGCDLLPFNDARRGLRRLVVWKPFSGAIPPLPPVVVVVVAVVATALVVAFSLLVSRSRLGKGRREKGTG